MQQLPDVEFGAVFFAELATTAVEVNPMRDEGMNDGPRLGIGQDAASILLGIGERRRRRRRSGMGGEHDNDEGDHYLRVVYFSSYDCVAHQQGRIRLCCITPLKMAMACRLKVVWGVVEVVECRRNHWPFMVGLVEAG